MFYEWNESKREINLMKHGVDFESAFDFEWDTAIETKDDRQVYDEQRWIALGMIEARLHVLIYTIRQENLRIISLRKANNREIQHYEKTKKHI